jgi:hypothetical protein
MSGSECPDLQSIVMLLQGAHRIRDEMIAHHRAGLALVKVETDLKQFNNQIADHRAFCPHCKRTTHGVIPRNST